MNNRSPLSSFLDRSSGSASSPVADTSSWSLLEERVSELSRSNNEIVHSLLDAQESSRLDKERTAYLAHELHMARYRAAEAEISRHSPTRRKQNDACVQTYLITDGDAQLVATMEHAVENLFLLPMQSLAQESLAIQSFMMASVVRTSDMRKEMNSLIRKTAEDDVELLQFVDTIHGQYISLRESHDRLHALCKDMAETQQFLREKFDLLSKQHHGLRVLLQAEREHSQRSIAECECMLDNLHTHVHSSVRTLHAQYEDFESSSENRHMAAVQALDASRQELESVRRAHFQLIRLCQMLVDFTTGEHRDADCSRYEGKEAALSDSIGTRIEKLVQPQLARLEDLEVSMDEILVQSLLCGDRQSGRDALNASEMKKKRTLKEKIAVVQSAAEERCQRQYGDTIRAMEAEISRLALSLDETKARHRDAVDTIEVKHESVVDALKASLRSAEQAMSSKETSYSQLLQAKEAAEKRVISLESLVSELQKQVDEQVALNATQSSSLSEKTLEVVQLRKEIDTLDVELESYELELASVRGNMNDKEAALLSKHAQLEQQCAQLTGELGDARSQLKSAHELLIGLETQNASLQATAASSADNYAQERNQMLKTVSDLQSVNDQAEVENVRLRGLLAGLHLEYDELKSRNEKHTLDYENLQHERTLLAGEKERSDADLSFVQGEHNRLLVEFKSQQEEHDRVLTLLSTTGAECDSLKHRIAELEEALKTVEYAKSESEDTLAARLAALLRDSDSTKSFLTSWSPSQDASQRTCLNSFNDKLSSMQKKVESLQSVCDSMVASCRRALPAEHNTLYSVIASLRKSNAELEERIQTTLREMDTEKALRLACEAQIEKALADLALTTTSLEEHKTNLRQWQEAHEVLTAHCDQLTSALKRTEDDLAAANVTVSSLHEERTQLNVRVQNLEESVTLVTESEKTVKETLDHKCASLTEELLRSRDLLTESEAKIQRKAEESEAYVQSTTNRIASLERQLNIYQQQLVTLHAEKDAHSTDTASQVSALKGQNEQLVSEKAALETTVADLKSQLSALSQQVEGLKIAMAGKASVIEELRTNEAQLELSLRNYEAAVQERDSMLVQYQTALSAAQQECENMRSRLAHVRSFLAAFSLTFNNDFDAHFSACTELKSRLSSAEEHTLSQTQMLAALHESIIRTKGIISDENSSLEVNVVRLSSNIQDRLMPMLHALEKMSKLVEFLRKRFAHGANERLQLSARIADLETCSSVLHDEVRLLKSAAAEHEVVQAKVLESLSVSEKGRDTLRVELSEQQQTCDKLLADLRLLSEERDYFQTASSSLAERLHAVETELAGERQRCADKESTVVRLETSVEEYETQVAHLSSELTATKGTIVDLQSLVGTQEKKIVEITANRDSLLSQMGELTVALEERARFVDELRVRCDTLTRTCEDRALALEEYQKKSNVLQSEMAQLRTSGDSLQSTIAHLLAEKQKEADMHSAAMRVANHSVETLRKELADAEARAEKLRDENALQASEHEKKVEEMRASGLLLNQQLTDVRDTLAAQDRQYAETSQQHEIEKNMLEEELQHVRAECMQLREEISKTSSALHESQMEKSNLATKTTEIQSELSATISALDRDLQRSREVICDIESKLHHKTEEAESYVHSSSNRIESLERQVAIYQQQLVTLHSEKDSLCRDVTDKLAILESENGVLKNSVTSILAENSGLKSDLEKRASEAETLMRELTDALHHKTEECGKLKTSLTGKQAVIEELRRNVEELEKLLARQGTPLPA